MFWSHVSLLVIINHLQVISTSWTNKLMEYISGQPPVLHLWIPWSSLPARKRPSQEPLQPIKLYFTLTQNSQCCSHSDWDSVSSHRLCFGKGAVPLCAMWTDSSLCVLEFILIFPWVTLKAETSFTLIHYHTETNTLSGCRSIHRTIV